MFRKPRDSSAVNPSLGRPPSPPLTPTPFTKAIPPTPKSDVPPPSPLKGRMSSVTPSKVSPSGNNTRLPTIGRQGYAKTTTPKQPGQANGSILSFFKKADRPDDTLFIADTGRGRSTITAGIVAGSDEATTQSAEEDSSRFNESEQPVKRRRLSQEPSTNGETAVKKDCTPPPDNFDDERNPNNPVEAVDTKQSHGPFLEDSDSENDEDLRARWQEHEDAEDNEESAPLPSNGEETQKTVHHPPPLLKHESTSYPAGSGFEEFDALGDFEDEYEGGEEALERRWMEQQRRIEQMEADGIFEGEEYEALVAEAGGIEGPPDESAVASCPLCSVSFEGVSDQDASVHVNNCLDGNPTPLPSKPQLDTSKSQPEPSKSQPEAGKSQPGLDVKRANNAVESVDDGKGISTPPKFKRPVRSARPAQASPFQLGQANGTSSAFSRLMSGHAEDAAWADAAAAENAARGKPSYQRTCPFYKILPGFFICVDGFRYGAVQGCNAYFLSHFHSDHYIGLTATWSHGPIYCSRPTANLVKQQLRVDPRYVVALEFEKKVEVPGTQGVFVTMIPANHCPGSSLYLFEKVVGRGPNPKVQRVLHCGDFRACPSHVEHPLLKPEVRDAITGKTAQQKIDVCYLDTTYLNPKWAFPSQEDVIRACSDMCISLNKTRVDESDGWEQMKRQRAGSAMAGFVQRESASKASDSTGKPEEKNKDGKDDRGRLLVVIGTYSIGKERMCLGIARALNSKIYAPAGKQRICAALEDEELNSRLTSDPRDAQVHMTPLFEIRAETLCDYLTEFSDRFKRAVGFRPTGWNYRPPGSRFTDSPSVGTVLYSDNWKSTYSMKDLVPQRGSNGQASCFGVPYSEHSSFRELTMFCCALRIDKIIPTVNVGSAKSRERMKMWCERWAMERKKNGLFKLQDENGNSQWYPGNGTWELRTTL